MALAQTPPATALVVAMASATRATALASVAQPARDLTKYCTNAALAKKLFHYSSEERNLV